MPQRRLADRRWRPELHAMVLGATVTNYGLNDVALMGISAARQHGPLPRAVVFVKRHMERLEVERFDNDLVTSWVTEMEQTLLDAADRSAFGGLTEDSAREIVRTLALRAGWDRASELSREQHKHATTAPPSNSANRTRVLDLDELAEATDTFDADDAQVQRDHPIDHRSLRSPAMHPSRPAPQPFPLFPSELGTETASDVLNVGFRSRSIPTTPLNWPNTPVPIDTTWYLKRSTLINGRTSLIDVALLMF
ncbi:hypothetical protein [Actinocorallia libanotica]|uniref:Uncharacterized protein n=1 Tax=Actinocorallia libanotica TaxID=46162 RepID=A0ABN1S2N2_9ACTN